MGLDVQRPPLPSYFVYSANPMAYANSSWPLVFCAGLFQPAMDPWFSVLFPSLTLSFLMLEDRPSEAAEANPELRCKDTQT